MLRSMHCQTCLRVGLVLGAWNCCFIKKAEKERLRRSKNILWPDLSKHFWAGLVSGLDLSRGRTCLWAGLFSGPDFSKNVGANSEEHLSSCFFNFDVSGKNSPHSIVNGRCPNHNQVSELSSHGYLNPPSPLH